MLDLDSLAERRAKSLNQKEDLWREAIWSTDFQEISASMSDGEVETLVSLCPSVKHLQEVVKYLQEQSKSQGLSPFTVLTQEADRAGVQPGQWIESRLGPNS